MTLTDEQRDAVLSEARTWVKTPWHHMGTVKGAGVDCGQLLIQVFHKAGIVELIDTGEYAQDWALHRSEEKMIAFIEKHATPVPFAMPADIVVYRFGRTYSHAAIVVDWPLVIHADRDLGEVNYADGEQGVLADHKKLFYSVTLP